MIRPGTDSEPGSAGKGRAMIEVSHALDVWAEGWTKHDMKEVASVFTEDCIYEDVALGVVNRGKDELIAICQGSMSASIESKKPATFRIPIGFA